MEKRPNILLITTDQQRKDTLGCYGNCLIHTPNIDSLAESGITMDREYCENPICIPSRNTLITGRYSWHHGAVLHNVNIRDSEPTLAKLLSDNGYLTHFIGKPHFKSQGHTGSEECVQDWLDGKYDHWDGPYVGFQGVEMVLGHCNIFTGHYGKWLREEHATELDCFRASQLRALDVSCGRGAYLNDIPEALHSSTYVGDRTCAFLEDAAQKDMPFFCFASFPSPHWPLMPPHPYDTLYQNTEMPPAIPYNEELGKDDYPWQYRELRENGKIPYDGNSQFVKNPNDIDAIKRLYWGEITLIDKNVGRIIFSLDKLGLRKNTIIVFTTDHGEYMGDHRTIAKGGFLWENFINLPCIFSFADRIPHGKRSNALMSHVDIAPTLLDLAKIDSAPLCADGISQAKVLTGHAERVRDCVTVMHPAQTEDMFPPDQHALVTEEWKLVYYAGTQSGELYHLKSDPEELHNLYHNPAFQSVRAELILKLLDELILHKDRYAIYQQKSGNEIKPFIMIDDVWDRKFKEVKSGINTRPLKTNKE